MTDRRAIEVLEECATLMRDKGKSYNNIPQTTYYDLPSALYKDGIGGEASIFNMMYTKVVRIMSLMSEPNANNKFEGIDDSARDLINYTAFLIEYMEGRMDENISVEDNTYKNTVFGKTKY